MINWKIISKVLILYVIELIIIFLLYQSFNTNSTLFGSLIVLLAIYNTFHIKYCYEKEVSCAEYEKYQEEKINDLENQINTLNEKSEKIFDKLNDL